MLRSIAEKLESFAAYFHLQGTLEQAKQIEAWIGHKLSFQTPTTLSSSLLPKKQKLSPHLNSWPETQAVMMPAKKTHRKRAGNEAYGAGESSGKKVKLLQKPMATEGFLLVDNHPNPTLPGTLVLPTNDEHAQPPVPFHSKFHPPPTSNYYHPNTHLY